MGCDRIIGVWDGWGGRRGRRRVSSGRKGCADGLRSCLRRRQVRTLAMQRANQWQQLRHASSHEEGTTPHFVLGLRGEGATPRQSDRVSSISMYVQSIKQMHYWLFSSSFSWSWTTYSSANVFYHLHTSSYGPQTKSASCGSSFTAMRAS